MKAQLARGPLRRQYCYFKIFPWTVVFTILIKLRCGEPETQLPFIRIPAVFEWSIHLLDTKEKWISMVTSHPKNSSLLRHHGFLILGPNPESITPHAEQLHYFPGIFQTQGHEQVTDQAKDSFCRAHGARVLIGMEYIQSMNLFMKHHSYL